MSVAGRTIYLHSEDFDGWTAPQNGSLREGYRACFQELDGLRCEAADGLHELRIVLNSGKAPGFLEGQAAGFGGRHVIGCSGASWRACGQESRSYAPPCEDFSRLRALLRIPEEAAGALELWLGNRRVGAAIEEGKRTSAGDIVLSLFVEPELVAHRWQFAGGTDRYELHAHLQRLIAEHDLQLGLLKPYPDGAVDVVRLVEGRPLAKWTLPEIASRIYPGATLKITHGGDGAGDVPAMEAPGVIPLSSVHCEATAECAASRGGIVAERSPEDGAVLECYAELVRREFYGPLSGTVMEVVERHLAAWQ